MQQFRPSSFQVLPTIVKNIIIINVLVFFAQQVFADSSFINIDNVFSLEWELEPYFKLASEFHYKIFVVTVENRHHGQNIHHISDEQIQKMARKYKVSLF